MGEPNDGAIMEKEEMETESRNGQEDSAVVESEAESSGACSLAWKDLTVMIALRNGKTQTILEQVCGYAEAGSFTALIGPSGSGKTTLLDALSGRLAPDAFLSGDILLNGRKANLSFGTVAYVTQDESLIGTLTVRETIAYSARLRLPDAMPWSEKSDIIENTILEMGLQDCADTVIGNWHLRGISGGESRRVSIALEILMRPKLLFLDEPTTGLDSASAFFAIQMLRGLAKDQRTVIASIHQPSSEVFELFDKLCLLSRGRTVYFGEASEAHEFFGGAGFPCPEFRNPADHFIRCINSDFDKVKETLLRSTVATDDDPLDKITAAEAIEILVDSYRSSEYCSAANEKIEEMSKVEGGDVDFGGSEASFLRQAFTLTQRSFINMWRDFGYYWLRLVVYIVVTLCIGTIYFDIGTGFSSIQGRGACSSFVFGFVTFMSIGGFPSFIEDMKVFQRERLNGHYGVGAFVISNTFSAMPYLIMISLVSGTICYYMVKFHSGFWHYVFFVLCLYACVSVVESLMMAIASVVPNFLLGILVGSGIQGIFMLVSGYFRLPNDIPKPVWRYPMSYMSFHFWALQGQYQNDLKGLMFDNMSPNQPKISGEFILENIFEIDFHRSKWVDLSVIFSMIITYRLIFLIMIKANEVAIPLIRRYIAKKRIKPINNTNDM
ncbi:ABC transporter G family member 11-like [Salvia splendens]|uniref:ABC transporter G family member 11-like n=1 Tax=Salvia splendens TaxID=180675 RepID=UPI001C27060E|nr:ABC transporter G family member 11-like [Salvia splendens]